MEKKVSRFFAASIAVGRLYDEINDKGKRCKFQGVGEREFFVLFEKVDGVYINLQGKDRYIFPVKEVVAGFTKAKEFPFWFLPSIKI